MNSISMLELYSGIGGMHYALKRAIKILNETLDYSYNLAKVIPVDLNNIVNDIYSYNFENIKVLSKNLENFTLDDLKKLNVNFISLSPPCQPYSLNGKQKKDLDPRSSSFLNLVSVLRRCEIDYFPKWIILENVAEFRDSLGLSELKQILIEKEMEISEFVISPDQIGVPNIRNRYYLLARKKLYNSGTISSKIIIQKEFPLKKKEIKVLKLKDFLEKTPSDDYILTKELKYRSAMDIVNEESTKSCCFTKNYHRYLKGTGSYIENNDGSLRYFTPREILNISGFPSAFSWPETITLKQKYRAIGNSISIFAVSELMVYLLSDPNSK